MVHKSKQFESLCDVLFSWLSSICEDGSFSAKGEKVFTEIFKWLAQESDRPEGGEEDRCLGALYTNIWSLREDDKRCLSENKSFLTKLVSHPLTNGSTEINREYQMMQLQRRSIGELFEMQSNTKCLTDPLPPSLQRSRPPHLVDVFTTVSAPTTLIITQDA